LTSQTKTQKTERGFTVVEKWIIWAVFCLLVGLSSDMRIFPALLLLSYAIVIFRAAMQAKRFFPAFWLAGSALLLSSILIWWAVIR
jgi:hypothetical protein